MVSVHLLEQDAQLLNLFLRQFRGDVVCGYLFQLNKTTATFEYFLNSRNLA